MTHTLDTTRRTRIGLALLGREPVPEMAEQARRAAGIGVDVVLLPDHIGLTAPLVPLAAVAAAAPAVRVGTLVLNTPLYTPAVLARDLAAVDSATGGRLEIGLGAGYGDADFTAAGLPVPTPAARVDRVAETATAVRRLLSGPDHLPRPVQSPPPIMIAGVGDRMLGVAARHADIAAFPSWGTHEHLADRVRFLRREAGDRIAEIELAFSFLHTGLDDPEDLSVMRFLVPDRSDDDLRRMAAYLPGPVDAAADRIRSLREELGITYVTFNLMPGVTWAGLEKLIAAVT
ncbi:TIGR03621 family F420-dependent LLM class oxidoreductase [Pseudonocardia endophytica]|uniref:Putative F420-dependent oxidoreductase n=1 Tax=Pseudonocardia endophytica TaxID=401976 RepID=A0A4R1HXI7_PSEEN|nr:TIGR03621 family F420-dependent LLM class oxidoreductase [Pseudonocardia endophytica]TCK25825.1 putative F420-dependent oxidoreductase [Pseudonocardia endophytica]